MSELISGVAGVVLSLVFSYVPWVDQKFAGLASNYKRLSMLGLVVVVAGALYGMSCAGWLYQFGIDLTCDQAGIWELVKAVGIVAIANQTAYQLSPETKRVAEIKAAR